MKKITSKVLLAVLILSSTPIAYAENATSTGTRERMENKIQDIKEKIQEKRVDVANKLINNRFQRMNRRFEATITRLEKIMARINSRIEKIKTEGGKTTDAEKFVADAKTSIDLAKAKLAELKTAGETTVTLENASSTRAQAKTALENLRKIAKDLEKNLQNARVSLSKAVGNLKGLSQMHSATTTQSN